MGSHGRVALFGAPGAGKSTTLAQLQSRGPVVALQLATPLYLLQGIVYSIAGRPLADPLLQDGVLLNFLGAHLRSINSRALIDDLERRLDALESVGDTRLVVCDDARPVDAEPLRALGFRTVLVDAPDEIRRKRLASRGDLRRGDESHSTERGIDGLVVDRTIRNHGTIGELDAQLDALLTELSP